MEIKIAERVFAVFDCEANENANLDSKSLIAAQAKNSVSKAKPCDNYE